jgi:hypothetical protein
VDGGGGGGHPWTSMTAAAQVVEGGWLATAAQGNGMAAQGNGMVAQENVLFSDPAYIHQLGGPVPSGLHPLYSSVRPRHRRIYDTHIRR